MIGIVQMQKGELMDDLISRKKAIEALGTRDPVSDTWTDEYELGTYKQWEQDIKAISEVPSAEPFVIKMDRFVKADERERLEKELYRKMTQQNLILLEPGMELVYPKRKGKWQWLPDRDNENIRYLCCSVCHGDGYYESNYCPNCGAAMSEGEEDDNSNLVNSNL